MSGPSSTAFNGGLGSAGVRSHGNGMAVSSSRSMNGSAVRHRHDAPSSEQRMRGANADEEPRSWYKGKGRQGKGKGKGKAKAAGWGIGRKGWVKEGFRRFGEHCARNQIRTLLIDCLVMTNLLYPSLALYLQKRFPPLHPPSPPAHNTHRLPLQGQAGSSRRVRKEHPLSLFSTPVLESFFPYPPPLLPRLTWAGWWGRDTGQVDELGWYLTRDGNEETGDKEMRVMRIAWADVGDVLDRPADGGPRARAWAERDQVLLRLMRDMAEGWEAEHPDSGERCVRRLVAPTNHDRQAVPDGPCYLLSPSPPLTGDLDAEGIDILPLSDFFPMNPAPQAVNSSQDGLPINWDPEAGNIYHSVATLFHVPRTASPAAFDDRWSSAIACLAKRVEGEVFVEPHGPAREGLSQTGQWQLSYSFQPASPPSNLPYQEIPPTPLSSCPPIAVWILYLVLFSVLGAQLSNASKVHSRFGLAFTGIVQLCCSSVMSFSVLALLGWNGWGSSSTPTTLPTYILPFVIVVVGAENMSTLTRAVFSIPFTYSVPVRIGLALSKVGTTISLTSLTDLVLLFTVWLCVNLRPVREFCVFAAVVIITDWFMLHTFFLTVLSIDAQRLEMADVLAARDGSKPTYSATAASDQEDSRSGGSAWRKVLRARSARVFSFVALLSSIGVLYYLTERHRSPHLTTANLYGYTPTTSPTKPAILTPAPVLTSSDELRSLNPSEALWRSLNPSGWPSIPFSVPAASIIILPKLRHAMLPADLRKLSVKTSRLVLPRLKPLFYLFKVVVLPQAVTAGALYILLLYLLKDADLLDAQRNRLGRGEEVEGEETDATMGLPNIGKRQQNPARNLSVHMLPCSHAADIDLIASSTDGRLVLSVGIDNTLCLWRFVQGRGVAGTREFLTAEPLKPGDPVVAAAVSADRRWVAVCSVSGVAQRWEIKNEDAAMPLPSVSVPGEVKVVGMMFDMEESRAENPFTARPSSPKLSEAPTLLVAAVNGTVHSIDQSGAVSTVIEPKMPSQAARVFFLPTDDRADLSLCIIVATQALVESHCKTPSGWTSLTLDATLDSHDWITCVDRISIGDVPTTFLALGHRAGLVEILDSAGSPLVTVSQIGEPVRAVSLVYSRSTKCTNCGSHFGEGFFALTSTSSQMVIDRVHPRNATVCRCPSPRRSSSIEDFTPLKSPPARQSTTPLVVPPSSARRSTPGNSPRKSPALLPPLSNGEFPVSSHGTRRLSAMHRDDATMPLSLSARPPSPGERSPGLLLSPANAGMGENGGGAMSGTSPASWVDFEVTSLGAIRSTGGGAVVLPDDEHDGAVEAKVVGLRRTGAGIDDAGWQVWSVDLTCPWNGSGLVVDSAPLDWLVRKAVRSPTFCVTVVPGWKLGDGRAGGSGEGTSIRDRRAERLLSLSGRASFSTASSAATTSHPTGGRKGNGWSSISATSPGSFAVPTHPGLAYVQVHPIVRRDGMSLVAGFGNRLGIIQLPDLPPGIKSKAGIGNCISGKGKGAVGGQGGINGTTGSRQFGTGLGIGAVPLPNGLGAGISGAGVTPRPPPPARRVGSDGALQSEKKHT